FLCSNANFDIASQQTVLEERHLQKKAEKCYQLMHDEFRKLELRNLIHQKTSKDLDKQQREYFLNQQLKTIQDELGNGAESDADELRKKAEKLTWSAEVQDRKSTRLNSSH